MINYLGYFSLTVAFESAAVWLMLRPFSDIRLVPVVLVLNAVTHPILWAVVGQQFHSYWLSLLVSELIAVVVEAGLGLVLLAKLGVSRLRLIFAIFVANLLSFAFTFVI